MFEAHGDLASCHVYRESLQKAVGSFVGRGRGTAGWSSRDLMETKKRDWKDGQMGTLKLINDRMKKEGTQDTGLRSGMLQAGLGFGR